MTRRYRDETTIYIPTYQRVGKQITLQRLPLSSGVNEGRVWLVATRKEAKALERTHNAQVLVQPDTVTNIAQKRAWIIEQCRSERLIMLDDDLHFFYRASFDSPSLKSAPPDHPGANNAWTQLEKALEHYAHAGLGARMGAQGKNSVWKVNTRMMYVLGYQTRVIQGCKLNSIGTREDMDYTLQLLRKGYRNLVNYRLVIGQAYAKAGGMTEERTIERSDRDAELLARRYKGIVKVEEKQYTHSIPRKEVRVNWKDAFNPELSSEEETKLTRTLLKKWGQDTTRNMRVLF